MRCELRLKKQRNLEIDGLQTWSIEVLRDIDCKPPTNDISVMIDCKSVTKIRGDLIVCVKTIRILQESIKERNTSGR